MTTKRKSLTNDYDYSDRAIALLSQLSAAGLRSTNAVGNNLYYSEGVQIAYPVLSVIFQETSLGSRKFLAIDNNNNVLQGPIDHFYTHDSQSENPAEVIGSVAVLTAKEAPLARSVFLDLNQQVTERATALIELIQTAPEFATQQTLELLRQASLDEKWIPYIVYATEELRFESQADQDLVWTRLLDIVREFRNRKEATFEKVVFSALRRVASLMPEDKVANLRPLLDNTGTVDTRLVGLQAIKTVFSVHPAKQICDPLLANRINELAIKFIDRDVLIPGQNSAIAETSILALACLKSDFVIPRLRQVAKLQLSWFSKILRKSLRQMSIQWDHSEATAKKWLDDLTSILE